MDVDYLLGPNDAEYLDDVATGTGRRVEICGAFFSCTSVSHNHSQYFVMTTLRDVKDYDDVYLMCCPKFLLAVFTLC